jgi:hypothetical protein
MERLKGVDEVCLNVVALGASGSGKSTFLSTLLDPTYEPTLKCYPSSRTFLPQKLQSRKFALNNPDGTVISVALTGVDTPGLRLATLRSNEEIMIGIGLVLRQRLPQISAFIICLRIDSIIPSTWNDVLRECVEAIGPRNYANTYLCFTHADGLTPSQCLEAFNHFSTHMSSVIVFTQSSPLQNDDGCQLNRSQKSHRNGCFYEKGNQYSCSSGCIASSSIEGYKV